MTAGARLRPLGLLLAATGAVALALLPFVVFKANRIATGEARGLLNVLPPGAALGLLGTLGVAAAAQLWRSGARLRLATALAALAALLAALALAADRLTPAGDRIVRVAPGGGFWLLLIVLALAVTDALARLKPGPLARVAILAALALAAGLALAGGAFDQLSILREYAVNASNFGREARQHAVLALGSTVAAVLAGLPLALLGRRHPRLRAPLLQLLNFVQTVPSIALFGILMVPLAALATRWPGLGELGITGIGPAPAAIALFLYALLPVVGNTLAGLARVSPGVIEAARGMGLTDAQVLARVEVPLALPVILMGVRIVLVQNIGLATIAALIGGGGFGTFVFQGVGQTAIDLVLLGAIPTVTLAFASAVLLDALIDGLRRVPA
ncbi:MAG: ABC transporter permease [Proteobacteria bacterium]|nr:ABC transporter permease [Pseudomonadota bacterium]